MADQTQFNIGDTVKLKSGGPDMTVRIVPEGKRTVYVCQWFAGKKLDSGTFPVESLVAVTLKEK